MAPLGEMSLLYSTFLDSNEEFKGFRSTRNELETLWQSETQVLLSQNFVSCTTRSQMISKGFVDDNHPNFFLTVETREHFAGTLAVAGVKD
jgi:hypothetical protein